MLNAMPASKFCTSALEIQDALDEAEQVREEGIIIKVSRLRPQRKGMSDCIVQITFDGSLVGSLLRCAIHREAPAGSGAQRRASSTE